MKVVHIINRLIGGGAEVMVPLIHRQHLAAGVDSWILSMETGDDRGTEKVFSFGKRYPRWREPFRLRKVLANMEENGPIDVVHTHLTQSQLFAKFAVRGLKKRPVLVTTEHDTSNRRREICFGRAFDQFLYHGYDRIICISEGVKKVMEDWVPAMSDRLVTIPNGVDLEPGRKLQRKDTIDRPIGFLSVGRLIPKKNFNLTIRALAKLSSQDWTYTIVGEGEELIKLQNLSRELGVTDQVHFAGYQSDVVPFYQKADVFLLPSLWEGFGLVAAEAMAAGIPVLASNVPGLAEVVGDAGWLLPSDNAVAWSQTMEKLVENPHLICQRVGRVRERAEEFSIDRTADGYMQVYRDVVGGCREGV